MLRFWSILILSCGLLASPASAAIGGLNGGDGDRACTTAGELDWDCLGGSDIATGSAQDATGATDVGVDGKELEPMGWDLAAGGSNGKTDFTGVGTGTLADGSDNTFLFLNFTRVDDGGSNVSLSFELNQLRTRFTNANGDSVPCRADGDVLVAYDGGSPVTMRLHRWQGTSGPAECPTGGVGQWIDLGLTAAGAAEGRMVGTFGEAALDLGAVATQAKIPGCEFFTSLNARSREAASINSQLGDYVATLPISVTACPKPPGGGVKPASPFLTQPTACQASEVVTLSGTATYEPGLHVEIREGTKQRAFAPVATDGTWVATLVDAVTDGSHTYTARTNNSAGYSGDSDAVTLKVDTAGKCLTPKDPDPAPKTPGTPLNPAGVGPTVIVMLPKDEVAVLGEQVRCSTKSFQVHLPATGVRRVAFKVDGKQVGLVKKANRQGRFAYTVNPAKYRKGVHKISATITLKNGKKVTVPMRSFSLCKVGTCVSRRAFDVRVKTVPGERIVSATVLVNGKQAKVVKKAGRFTAKVRLVKLPRGAFKVKIRAVTATGKVVHDTRTYRTCVKKTTS